MEEFTISLSDEEEIAEEIVAYKKMVEKKIPVDGWDIVEAEEDTYYIMYVD